MRINKVYIILFILALGVFSIDQPICVDVKTVKVQIDSSYTIVPKLLSKVYSGGTLNFISLNEKIATIDSQGLITPKSVGKTEIKVTCADHPIYEAIVVEIYNQIATESLSLESETTMIKVGQSIQLTVYAEPAHKKLNFNDVSCSFANTSVLSMNNGVMTGINEGSTSLTCSYTENSKVITQNKFFVVYTFIETDNIIIESESDRVKIGQIITLKVYANPGHRPLNNTEIIYSTTNKAILTVSKDGKVYGISVGNASVTATYFEYDNSYLAQKTFMVYEPEVLTDSIVMESDTTSLKTGESTLLRVYANPNKRLLNSSQVSFSSNHPEILITNNEGKVTGIQKGSATITASYFENGNTFKTTLIFSVYTDIVTTNIGIEAAVTDVMVGNTVYINVFAYPANRKLLSTEVQCSAFDTSVIQVYSNLSLKGKSVGTTDVKCNYTENGITFEDSKLFTVYVETLRIDSDQDSVVAGQSMKLRVYLMPYKTPLFSSDVVLSSSNEAILKPGNYLSVIGVSQGNATITCTYLTKNIVGTKELTVTQDSTVRIVFEAKNNTLKVYEEIPLTAYLEPGHVLIEENDTNLYYTTEDPHIIRVEGRKIIGVDEGSTEIYAVYIKNYNEINVRSSQRFTVYTGIIPVQRISFSFENITVIKGNPFSFQVRVDPPKANNRAVIVTAGDGFYPYKNTGIKAENVYTMTPTLSGKTTITAVSAEDETISSSFELTIEETSTRGGGYFAKGIDIENGWFDCNKEWEGRENATVMGYNTTYLVKDSSLCWAATTANLIDWYQQSINFTNVPVDTPYGPTSWENGTVKANDNTAYSQSVAYEYIRLCSTNEGYFVGKALNWFFTGADTLLYDNLYERGSRYTEYVGFEKNVRVALDNYVGSDQGRDYYIEYLKKMVIPHIKRGTPMGLNVKYTCGRGHAITLWGYELGDFDMVDSGECLTESQENLKVKQEDLSSKRGDNMISYLYITDSDDGCGAVGGCSRVLKPSSLVRIPLFYRDDGAYIVTATSCSSYAKIVSLTSFNLTYGEVPVKRT
ncbi:hypothetical protein EIN_261570 [Entamoeba invadens IP1]|uniref:BIG2 domain-containing protein n=1 Tax=Entamoeba invadens IP1 TaxID=370355 RepID=L7FP49_ENTIV|nr:hypothetical protein EIN_261570 [Entamoeba invadens IP1]ELP95346.1 hypothetical protein EIN_261570 [Entamoeba invadens IP1]|eukprot:XP_004262117.1 hypothetical protein EIN_261570 [Entamoeba invadens IP1]